MPLEHLVGTDLRCNDRYHHCLGAFPGTAPSCRAAATPPQLPRTGKTVGTRPSPAAATSVAQVDVAPKERQACERDSGGQQPSAMPQRRPSREQQCPLRRYLARRECRPNRRPRSAGNMRPLLPGDRSARSHAGPVRWRGSHSRQGMESGCAKDTKSPATHVARAPAYRCRGLLHKGKRRLAEYDGPYTEASTDLLEPADFRVQDLRQTLFL